MSLLKGSDTLREMYPKVNSKFADLDAKDQELKDELDAYKLEHEQQRQSDQLKVAKVEKELNDYKATMQQVNIHQNPTQKASGHGIVSLPPNAAEGQISVTLKGRTVNNLMGTDGDCEDTSKFTAMNCTLALDTTNKVFGNNGIKVTIATGQTQGIMSYNIFSKLNKAKYYLITAYLKKGNCTDLKLRLETDDVDIESSVVIATSFTRVGIVVQPSDIDTATSTVIQIIVNGAEGQYGYVDGIMVNEITSEEYALGAAVCMSRYNYHNSTKSTVSASRLKSVGKNLFDKGANPHRVTPDTKVYETDTGVRVINTSEGTWRRVEFKLNLEPNTAYILSFDPKVISGTNYTSIRGHDNRTALRTDTYSSNIPFVTDAIGTTFVWLHSVDGNPGAGEVFYNNLQLEKGDTPTEYEPYKESIAYITAKDKDNKIVNLRSLPNGIKDEVSDKGILTRRNGYKVLESSDVIRIITNYTNLDYIVIPKPIDYIGYENTSNANNNLNVDGFLTSNYLGSFDTVDAIGKAFSNCSSLNIWIGVAKDVYADLTSAKTAIAGKSLTYQLATPLEIPIQVSGTLVSYPSGTVYVEPFVADAGLYNNGITVLHQDLPIKSIEKISKIDYETGIEYELDKSKVVINTDKLSLTHPDLQNGDIVFFIYEYDKESTIPEIEVEFYDSRYVVKDSATGKFYKWSITVTNGTPSIQLTEV